MIDQQSNNNVAEIAKLAIQTIRPDIIEGVPTLIVHKDYEVKYLEQHAKAPARNKQSVSALSLAGFVRAFDLLKTDTATILADTERNRINGFTTYSRPDAPKHHDHAVVLCLTDSKEWQAWKAINERGLSQKDFFTFLEDHLDDIIEPEPAALLEIAETVRGTKKVNFENSQKLSTGDISLVWTEVTEAKAGEKGTTKIPGKIKIRIPLHEQDLDTLVEVTANFRILITEGRLTLAISIRHLAKINRMGIKAMCEKIAKAFPDVPMIEGV